MALADNATGMVNLKWDYDMLEKVAEEWDIEGKDWGVDINNMDFFDIDDSDIPEVDNQPAKDREKIFVRTGVSLGRMEAINEICQKLREMLPVYNINAPTLESIIKNIREYMEEDL